MSKETTRVVAIAAATFTGLFTAVVTGFSKREETFSKREVDFKRLELEQQRLELERQKFMFEQEKLKFNKEKLEFDKINTPESTNLSDYKETISEAFKNMPENTSSSSTDFPNINSSFESAFNTSDLLVNNISLTFICFTSVTIICTISLTFNYLVKMYGDSLKERLPKVFHPFYKFYGKYLMFSSLFDFSMILLCNGVGLLLCLYLFLF